MSSRIRPFIPASLGETASEIQSSWEARRGERSPRMQRLRDEDAERVTGRVGIDPKRFLDVIGPVAKESCTEGERAVVFGVERGGRRHSEIQVSHLRVWPVRPCHLGQVIDPLEGDLGPTRRTSQDQPVLPVGIRLTLGRRLVTRAVLVVQKQPVELRKPPRVRAVEDHLA